MIKTNLPRTLQVHHWSSVRQLSLGLWWSADGNTVQCAVCTLTDRSLNLNQDTNKNISRSWYINQMKKRNNFKNQNPVLGFQSVQKSENIEREKHSLFLPNAIFPHFTCLHWVGVQHKLNSPKSLEPPIHTTKLERFFKEHFGPRNLFQPLPKHVDQ